MTANFDKLMEQQISGASQALWLQKYRRTGWSEFQKKGLPSRKDEAWKYTDMSFLAKETFSLPETATTTIKKETQFSDISMLPSDFKSFCCGQLVFVNGRYHSGLSFWPKDLLEIAWISNPQQEPDLAVKETDLFDEDAMANLNRSGFSDLVRIQVRDKVRVKWPLLIWHVTRASQEPSLQMPRITVDVGVDASLPVIEGFEAEPESSFVSNRATLVRLRKGASWQGVQVVASGSAGRSVHSQYCYQEEGSRFHNLNLSLPSRFVRNTLEVTVAAEQCETQVDGIYLGRGSDHIDNCTLIRHKAPHCLSRQTYKGIMADQSRAIFNGKIIVEPGAQKIEAHQLNRSLLLSRRAEVDTRPQLEIYADDVTCTHGATVGQLSQEELFYLQSRGIPLEAGAEMLKGGFLKEVLWNFEHESLRKSLFSLIEKSW